MHLRIAVGSDHAGFELKTEITTFLQAGGYEVTDVGAHVYESSDDYPDFALALGQAVAGAEVDRGVLVCGSGVGASIAANKIVGVRAGMCHDTYSAHQGVEHDDMNVLVVGARVIGVELAREVIRAFVNAKFSGEERHLRRLGKVRAIESSQLAAGRH